MMIFTIRHDNYIKFTKENKPNSSIYYDLDVEGEESY